jgi:hypothetical protein
MLTETQAWMQVPYEVQRLFVKYAGAARDVVEASDDPRDWHFETDEVGTVKLASPQKTPMLGPARKVTDTIQSLGGGPNPLTATLLGGGLGALLGYGGGKLLHKFAPDYFEEDVGSRLGLPLGALLGAGIPAVTLGGGMHRMYGPKGWLMKSPVQGGRHRMTAAERKPVSEGGKVPDWYSQYGFDKEPQASGDDYQGAIDRLAATFNIQFEKDAFFDESRAGGAMYVPDVEKDMWGRVIMHDPLMPAQTKAIVAGLPMATGAANGSKWVSPADIGRVAANAGLGWGMGRAIGMIAGPVLRLTPKARTGIQNAGLLTGAFKALGFL